ncbi:MAG: hypothetical protein M1827_003751, partial [Pycnora praestabilis]
MRQSPPGAALAWLLAASPRIASRSSPFDMNTSCERRDQLLSHLMSIFLSSVNGQIPPSYFAYRYTLSDIVGQHPAIPPAVDALRVVQIGNSYSDEEVLVRLKSLYGEVLSHLSRGLARPELYSTVGTITAISVLNLFE